jgi:hypothetical protein
VLQAASYKNSGKRQAGSGGGLNIKNIAAACRNAGTAAVDKSKFFLSILPLHLLPGFAG